jgi:hypothetical protein
MSNELEMSGTFLLSWRWGRNEALVIASAKLLQVLPVLRGMLVQSNTSSKHHRAMVKKSLSLNVYDSGSRVYTRTMWTLPLLNDP